ncbi:MAG: methionine adenosyltransferase, partial [Anaerolineae bacterium]|nr:methionine adenosyltransferase [Anaerolineae bacterium]
MTSPSLLFTSESVSEGHPDKMCDQISDAVLDALMEQDPYSRVACETAIKTGFVMLLGEITTSGFVDFDKLVRNVINDIGFDCSEKGFDGNTCGVQLAIAAQSPDIAMGVDKAKEAKEGQMSEDEI